MAFDSLVIKEKVALTLNPTSGAGIIPLFNYSPYTKLGYKLISESLEISDLKAISWIDSTSEVEFPIFEITDSESKQLLTAINLEWTSPRIQLDLLCQINTNWHKIASYSLLNSSPFPYRQFSLGNHTLGNNSMLGLQIIDVGHGSITEQDRVTILGDLSRNIVVEKLTDTSTKVANNITTIPAIIINSNPNRKGLTIFNNSNLVIYLDTVSSVSATSYMVKLQVGSYWEAPAPIYTGNYYAVVESGSTAIDIREFM